LGRLGGQPCHGHCFCFAFQPFAIKMGQGESG
jgi:hypothetical protein